MWILAQIYGGSKGSRRKTKICGKDISTYPKVKGPASTVCKYRASEREDEESPGEIEGAEE